MRHLNHSRIVWIFVLILCVAVAAGCKKQDTPDDPAPPADTEQPSGTDDGNASGEDGSSNPVTTLPAGSITVGPVEIDPDEIKALQDRVDAGEQLWLLDPLEVAKREGPKFGFTDRDTYHLISQVEAGEGSGTGEAIVQVVHSGDLYFIQLIQPNGPGEDSIWWINAVLRDAK